MFPRTPPLDNYATRPHFSDDNNENDDKPVLVVGGSDGSGTRVFVDLLGKLGVPMVVDDTGTLDVHAKCLFDGDGWPALIRTVLQTTHTANYSWDDDLSLVQQSMLQSALDEFVTLYGQRGTALRRHGESQGVAVATKVKYGWKAPVSMLVLPVLRHVYGRLKFLHVVRDGRDVSLSNNKSPVQKFYKVFYPDARQRRDVLEGIQGDIVFEQAMAIQLWNDWNVQVLDWEQRHADGQTFDFLVVRTEDLMNPATRFAAIRQLANFVGAQLGHNDLCCLSRQPIQDMGKSGVKLGQNTRAKRRPHTWYELYLYYHMLAKETWHRMLRYVGIMDQRPAFGEQQHVRRVGGQPKTTNVVVVGSAAQQELTDEQDLPLPDVLRGIEEEREAVDQTVRQQRPELFRNIQLRRDQRFRMIQQMPQQHHDRQHKQNRQDQQGRRLQEEEEEDAEARGEVDHGDAKRVPWRDEEQEPRVKKNKKMQAMRDTVVDHVKSGTMLEKTKSAAQEEEQDASSLSFRDRHAASLGRHWGAPAADEEEPPETAQQVMERYGKWREATKDRPELHRVLHQEAEVGLRLFGYEPGATFSDFADMDEDETNMCGPSVVCT